MVIAHSSLDILVEHDIRVYDIRVHDILSYNNRESDICEYDLRENNIRVYDIREYDVRGYEIRFCDIRVCNIRRHERCDRCEVLASNGLAGPARAWHKACSRTTQNTTSNIRRGGYWSVSIKARQRQRVLILSTLGSTLGSALGNFGVNIGFSAGFRLVFHFSGFGTSLPRCCLDIRAISYPGRYLQFGVWGRGSGLGPRAPTRACLAALFGNT